MSRTEIRKAANETTFSSLIELSLRISKSIDVCRSDSTNSPCSTIAIWRILGPAHPPGFIATDPDCATPAGSDSDPAGVSRRNQTEHTPSGPGDPTRTRTRRRAAAHLETGLPTVTSSQVHCRVQMPETGRHNVSHGPCQSQAGGRTQASTQHWLAA